MWGRAFQEGNSKCKGPDVSMPVMFKDTEEGHVAGRNECRGVK